MQQAVSDLTTSAMNGNTDAQTESTTLLAQLDSQLLDITNAYTAADADIAAESGRLVGALPNAITAHEGHYTDEWMKFILGVDRQQLQTIENVNMYVGLFGFGLFLIPTPQTKALGALVLTTTGFISLGINAVQGDLYGLAWDTAGFVAGPVLKGTFKALAPGLGRVGNSSDDIARTLGRVADDVPVNGGGCFRARTGVHVKPDDLLLSESPVTIEPDTTEQNAWLCGVLLVGVVGHSWLRAVEQRQRSKKHSQAIDSLFAAEPFNELCRTFDQ